jgi:hypothetical protein
MVVKQLSVFLENKANSLNKMLQVLTDNGINMSAFCVADSVDYGIVRFCVGRPELAYQILKDNNHIMRKKILYMNMIIIKMYNIHKHLMEII